MIAAAEALTLLLNLLVAFAACAGAIAAFMGLSTWKAQAKWQRDYELARSILISLFKHRDAIKNVRNPFMLSGEMSSDDGSEVELESPNHRRFNEKKTAYVNRWSRVQEVNQALSSYLIEADVLWGPETSENIKGLRKLERELWSGIHVYLCASDPDEDEDIRAEYRDMRKANRKRRLLYEVSSGEDPYFEEYQAELEKVEELLKPYLGRSS